MLILFTRRSHRLFLLFETYAIFPQDPHQSSMKIHQTRYMYTCLAPSLSEYLQKCYYTSISLGRSLCLNAEGALPEALTVRVRFTHNVVIVYKDLEQTHDV